MEISKKLIKIIEEVTNLENLNESMDLASASVSSIDFIKIIVEIENEFDIEFEDDDLEKDKFINIDDLAKYVIEKQNINRQDGRNDE